MNLTRKRLSLPCGIPALKLPCANSTGQALWNSQGGYSIGQPSGYVSVGLVIVLALLVYFFDFTLFCCEKDGLDIVIDEVRINVTDEESGQAMPAIIDGIGREVGHTGWAKVKSPFDDLDL